MTNYLAKFYQVFFTAFMILAFANSFAYQYASLIPLNVQRIICILALLGWTVLTYEQWAVCNQEDLDAIDDRKWAQFVLLIGAGFIYGVFGDYWFRPATQLIIKILYKIFGTNSAQTYQDD